MEIRATGFIAAQSANLSFQHVHSTVSCRFPTGLVAASKEFFDDLYSTDSAARCIVIVSPKISEKDKLDDEWKYEGLLHPSGRHSAMLLLTAPCMDGKCPNPHPRQCATPNYYSPQTSPCSVDAAPPASLNSSSIGQKNLRRQRTILNSSPCSNSSTSGGGRSTVNGIASGIVLQSNNVKVPGVVKIGDNETATHSSYTPTFSSLSWIKDNATSIGNSPLTSPSRPSTSRTKRAAATWSLTAPPPAPDLIKSSSCPELSASTITHDIKNGIFEVESKELSPVPSPQSQKQKSSTRCHALNRQYSSTDHLENSHLNPTPPSVFTSLSPCGDSGSRSIFPELLMENDAMKKFHEDNKPCKKCPVRSQNDTMENVECGGDDLSILEYSNTFIDSPNSSKYVHKDERELMEEVGGNGNNCGLFSSVMKGAALHEKLSLNSQFNDSRDSVMATASSIGAENDFQSTKPDNGVSVFSTIPSCENSPLEKISGRSVDSGLLSTCPPTLSEIVAGCVFKRELSPFSTARKIIAEVYNEMLIETNLSRKEVSEILQQRNDTVATLCKKLFQDMNTNGGAFHTVSHVKDFVPDDSDSSRHSKTICKAAGCVLYILLFLENERIMRNEYKKFKAIAKPPSGKVMLKCLGKLNACCRMKGLDDNGMSKNSLRWMLSSTDDQHGACSDIDSKCCDKKVDVKVDIAPRAIPECKTVPDDASKENSVVCTVDLLPEAFVNIFVQFCEEKYFGFASVRVLLRAHQKLISSEDELEDVTAKSLSCTSSNKNKSEKKIHHYDKDKTSVREVQKVFQFTSINSAEGAPPTTKINASNESGARCLPCTVAEPTSSTSRKNSLVSARVSLNGHRAAMEGRLRSQQKVTSTIAGSVGGINTTRNTAKATQAHNIKRKSSSRQLKRVRPDLIDNTLKKDEPIRKKLFPSAASIFSEEEAGPPLPSRKPGTIRTKRSRIAATSSEFGKDPKCPRPSSCVQSRTLTTHNDSWDVVDSTPLLERASHCHYGMVEHPEVISDTPIKINSENTGTPVRSTRSLAKCMVVANTPI